MEIFIISNQFKHDELIDSLENTPGWDSKSVKLTRRRIDHDFKETHTNVLVAIISATNEGIESLITGLLCVAKESVNEEIVVHTTDDKTLDVPADSSTEKIEELVEIIKKMKSAKIEI